MPFPYETGLALSIHRVSECRLRLVAVTGDADALQSAVPVQVATDLLELDPSGLIQGNPADPGTEGDQRHAPRTELVGLCQGARRGVPDDLGRGRSAENHRCGVDH